MGNKDSKNRNIGHSVRLLPREPLQEFYDIPDVEPGYPPPRTPSTSKKDIYSPRDNRDIYFHALRAPRSIEGSWDDLVHYLTSSYRTEMMKVRSIFTWLGQQEIERETFFLVSTPTDIEEVTPRGFKKMIKKRMGSYASFFALLCRKAGIKCAIISGLSKGFGYDVAVDEVSQFRDRWNAVYIDGWRLVHPLWAYKSIMNSKPGRWVPSDLRLEPVDGFELGDEDLTLADHDFNEYFFLVHPNELINLCLPDNEAWQLCSSKMTLKRWIGEPLFANNYHIDKFRFTGNLKEPIKANHGSCGLTVKAPATNYQMSYDLYFNMVIGGKTEVEEPIYLKRYVLMSRNVKEDKWVFEVRLPISGTYRLTTFGGKSHLKNLPWIGDVGILADDPKQPVRPYPDAPAIGYGPVHMTEVSGLTEPSHPNGILFVKPRQTIHITFKITDSLIFKATMIGEHVKESEMDKWAKATKNNQSKLNILDVVVNLLQEGEYAVKIFARPKDGPRQTWRNVCNYYLSTDKPRASGQVVKDKGYKTAFELNARKALDEAAKGRDLHDLKNAMHQFETVGLHEVDGSFGKATQKMAYLELAKALKDGINRRNYELLCRAISQAEASDHVTKLQVLLGNARDEKDRLMKLNSFMHDVLEMKQSTISEVTSYTKPPQVIHDVLMATLMLLGEKRNMLDSWETVSAIFRRLGTDSILRRVRGFNMSLVTPGMVKSVSKVICQYDEDTVKTNSVGAATFYRWTKSVVDTMSSDSEQSVPNNMPSVV